MHSFDRATQTPASVPEQRVARRGETSAALVGMLADSPRVQSQLQLQRAMDGSPRVTAQARFADEINRRPVVQRVVSDKLPNGTLVTVHADGSVGNTTAETDDGYRVDVGGQVKSFTYEQLDIPPSLTSKKKEGWLTAEAHGLREMAISLITDVPPEK